MPPTPWTTAAIPDQTGRTVIVTGANSGIGFESALALAGAGAQVVLACRDAARTQPAIERIRQAHPTAKVAFLPLDLASLESVAGFVATFQARYDRLDILMNNAGIMALPFGTTPDGFERQFGTNHLGHFALTGRLLDQLTATPKARIVTVSSTVHKSGRMAFDDLQGKAHYAPWTAYAQSKLANLLFAYELDRRLKAAGHDTISVASHPGYTATNLQSVGPQMAGSRFMATLFRVTNRLMAQTADMGALPQIRAAVDPELTGGEYLGPGGFQEIRGYPVLVTSNARSHDVEAAARLWAISEDLTGVRASALAGAGVPSRR
jgi:NAD(P)-dependent dehydrogenase (short-subunit alcohol dehydrogenase family)